MSVHILFGEVREAAHRADTTELMGSLDRLERLAPDALDALALPYVHELLWRNGKWRVSAALRRWAHPDIIPALVMRAREGGHSLDFITRAASASVAPSAWIDAATLEALEGADRFVWHRILAMDLPRVHAAAFEHEDRYVRDASRVPPTQAIEDSVHRARLVADPRLDEQGASALRHWAGDDFTRMCALAESSSQRVLGAVSGPLFARLAAMTPERRESATRSQARAHQLALAMNGEAFHGRSVGALYTCMSYAIRERFITDFARGASDVALAALARVEDDPGLRRELVAAALARPRDARTFLQLLERYPEVPPQPSPHDTSVVVQAFDWLDEHEDAASMLFLAIDTQSEPMRRALAQCAHDYVRGRGPEVARRTLTACAALPFMHPELRRVLSRSSDLEPRVMQWAAGFFAFHYDAPASAPEEEEHGFWEDESPRSRRRGRRTRGKGSTDSARLIDEGLDELEELERYDDLAFYDRTSYYYGVEDGAPCALVEGTLSASYGRGGRPALHVYTFDAHGSDDEALERIIARLEIEIVYHELRHSWSLRDQEPGAQLARLETVCHGLGIPVDYDHTSDPGEAHVPMIRLDDPDLFVALDERIALIEEGRHPVIELAGCLSDPAHAARIADHVRPHPKVELDLGMANPTLRAYEVFWSDGVMRPRTHVFQWIRRAYEGLLGGAFEDAERVDLANTWIDDDDVDLIARSCAPGELILDHTRLTWRGVLALIDRMSDHNIQKVSLRGIDLEVDALETILSRVDLEKITVSAGIAKGLTMLERWPDVVCLHGEQTELVSWLRDPVGPPPRIDELDPDDFHVLATHPSLIHADVLSFRTVDLPESFWTELLTSPSTANLLRISVAHYWYRPRGEVAPIEVLRAVAARLRPELAIGR